jgi:MFS family permease
MNDRLATRPFFWLILAHLLQAMGWTSLLLLPVYLEHLGGSRQLIGEVMAVGSVGGLIAQPIVGFALERFGRRPTLIVATAVLCVGLAGFGLVTEIGTMLYVSRFIFGLGGGALFSGYFTFAADIVPASRRTEGLALFGIAGLAPMLLNPFVGALVSDPGLLRWLFPTVSVIAGLSVLCILAVPEPQRSVAADRRGFLGSMRRLLAPGLLPPYAAGLTFAVLAAVFMTFSTVVAKDVGIENAAIVWLTYAIGAISVRVLGGKLPDRIGTYNMVAPSLALYAGGLLALMHAETLSGVLLAGGLAGIGHGYGFPVLTSQLMSRVGTDLRGPAMALFIGLWEVSALIAPPLFGTLADSYGDRQMLLIAANTALVGLVVWAALELATSRSRG